jgi:hypothetical protein
MVASMVGPALALPKAPGSANPIFELDGDATTNIPPGHTGLPDDADRVCHEATGGDCSTTSNTTGAGAVAFGTQPAASGTTFTGGGSKDPIDISSWLWNQGTGGLPGKDILLNGFAARYSTPSTGPSDPSCPAQAGSTTCSVLFFGMDRFDNSGDAQNGFWFFQNAISLGGGKGGGGSNFVGVHKPGDVLVTSDFSIGGTISTISVYKWDPTCTATNKPASGGVDGLTCADSNLELLGTSTSANCTTAAGNAAFCGIVNPTNGTTSPWPFLDKTGHTVFQQGEYYEGGIDLSAFPGLARECFASMLAESRSSTSTSATLKSFVLMGFAACGSKTVTHPQDSGGNDITNGSISIGTGAPKVQDQAIVTVTGASSFGGSVNFFLCGPDDLGTQSSCVSGGTQVGSAKAVSPPSPVTVTSDQATITKVGNYCWRAEYSGDSSVGVPPSLDNSTTECFSVTPVTPTLSTQASGPIQLGQMISDTATLGSTASEPGTPVINPTTPGSPAKGTISFTVFGPDNCTTVLGTSTASVNGNGAYPSGNFKPTAVGTYTFVASYSGDSPNTNAVPATACPDTTGTEKVLVTDTATETTAQTWLPNDSATVTTTGGSPIGGTVTFTLYNNGTCTPGAGNANVLYTQTVPASGSSPQTVNTSNTSVSVTASKTVSWQASYAPSGANISATPSDCEVTQLTITN